MFDHLQAPQIDPELLLGTEPLPAFAGPVRLNLSDRAMRERHSVLRECFTKIGYRYEISPLSDVPFEADLMFNMLPDILVAEGKLHGSSNRRTKSIIDDDVDEAVLMINLRGPHLIEQFGRELELSDGEAVLISGTDPSCFTHKPPGNLLGLRVPKSRLTPMLKNAALSYMQRIPAANATLALLRNYVGLTWSSQAAVPSVRRLMADHIFDLMALAIGPAGDAAEAARGNGLHAAKLEAVKQDIAKLLDRPDLAPAMLADRHCLTTRSLQRLFEAEGTTFTKYVLSQRLLRAHRMLAGQGNGAGKISTIAYDCGFGDVSYFNRAFRRHYGAAPSAIRALSEAHRG